MPEIRICSFNVEWMNDWFVSGSGGAAFKTQFHDRDSSHLNDTNVTVSDPNRRLIAENRGQLNFPRRKLDQSQFA